jgi:DNA-binding NtrC family response regulator
MVGPYGLRAVAARLASLVQSPPGNICLEGETGTGKELLAAHVARALGRGQPYAAINVAGVAAGVFESQLFGHQAGAFSDAKQAALGVVRAHAGGSVFLDEIAELPLALQPKLLRLLENHEVLPVGSDTPVKVDVLFIAASSRSMEDLTEQGLLRRDLFARLAIGRIQVPPLRDRAEDIWAIIRRLAPGVGLRIENARVEGEAVERLMREPWPHNVRGLIGALREIAAADSIPGLALWAVEHVLGARPSALPAGTDLTAEAVAAALTMAGGNETQAARLLGISRGRLRRFRDKG